MSEHVSPQELRRKWKLANAEPLEGGHRLEAYRALAQRCPAFVPNLLSLSRTLLAGRHDAADPEAAVSEVEQVLRSASDVSAGAPEPLLALGHFLVSVRQAPDEAERAFSSAASAAMALLEEAWAGWIHALGAQGQLEAALEVEERARSLFPSSKAISQAVAFARAQSGMR
ncbi:hypothetical protein [Myxococcus virescens]|uniref:Tetratrico peptide repeat group 5 domain-containing protein n=1 Tax=Myxococcus virescens TaxID=83456 RepID=A0A511HBA2_9BACT|nr:hypothetical protein [Myxococcus virescens]GEL70837.1 hypothetical protein MVI01_26210 [Myxococcus virescens]SDE22329.1 hypothetical protein SAMN04488504_105104 [Myxococcus virescens]